jgi:hypothetical protein
MLVNPNFNPVFGQPTLGAQYIQAIGTNLSTGDTDLYTVPTGKRALIQGFTCYNTAAGSIVFYSEIKVSGTRYRIAANVTVSTNTASSQTVSIVLEAGESLSINTATNNGLNVFPQIIEFDSASPLKSARIIGPTTGDNTLYTVPTGKSTLLVSASNAVPPASGAIGTFVTDSGGSRTIIWYVIPSGQSVGTGYRTQATTITASNRGGANLPAATMAAGDFININVDTGNANQVTWTNLVEL